MTRAGDMTKPRRSGSETSETRARLLDITEQVMLTDGYAAVTSRRVAADAGVTPALVHYYFSTIDDLFLAVIRRRGAQQAKRQERALSSDRPIHALWELSKERAGTGLLTEFIALANHRKAIAAELAEQVAESRQAQLEAMQRLVGETDAVDLPPEAMLVLIASVSRTIALEESLGMEEGLAQVAEFVERLIAVVDDHTD
jgi:AcrR family transcriptional regulator